MLCVPPSTTVYTHMLLLLAFRVIIVKHQVEFSEVFAHDFTEKMLENEN